VSSQGFPHAPTAHPPFGGMSGGSADPLEGPHACRVRRRGRGLTPNQRPPSGARVALSTLLTSTTRFLRIRRADARPTRPPAAGCWSATCAGTWQPNGNSPTHSQLNG